MTNEERKIKQRQWSKAYRLKNLETVRRKNREYEATHPEKGKRAAKLHRQRYPEQVAKNNLAYRERSKELRLISRYNLTKAQYEELITTQNGLCSACGTSLSSGIKAVDHDHKTLKVRGIIHRQCNSMIGLAKESADILERAAKYLRSHE